MDAPLCFPPGPPGIEFTQLLKITQNILAGDREACSIACEEHFLLAVLAFTKAAIAKQHALYSAAGCKFGTNGQGLILTHNRSIHAQNDRTYLALNASAKRQEEANNSRKGCKGAIHEGISRDV
jgi:hypothetical protein